MAGMTASGHGHGLVLAIPRFTEPKAGCAAAHKDCTDPASCQRLSQGLWLHLGQRGRKGEPRKQERGKSSSRKVPASLPSS